MGFQRSPSSGLRGTRALRRHCRVRTMARQRFGRFEGKSQGHGRIRSGGGAEGRYDAVTDISDDKLRGSIRGWDGILTIGFSQNTLNIHKTNEVSYTFSMLLYCSFRVFRT
jgi:hypothetical protein